MNANDGVRLTNSALRAGLWFLTFVEVAVALVRNARPSGLLRLRTLGQAAAVGQTTTLIVAVLPIALLILTSQRLNNYD